ncbi:MAG: hypothetical protein EOM68_18105 [Spirochaetia bacterium]|nr:hypothetical protein [Spirochaetia bacterium]
MTSNYRIYRRRLDLGSRINQLHSTEQLAIGILDVGTGDQLCENLSWYVKNMNYALHVVTQEGRMDIQAMQEAYKEVTFLVFPSSSLTGEKINAVANECQTSYFLIVRSDLVLVRFDGIALFSLMREKEAPAALASLLANMDKEIVPTIRSPHLKGRKLDPNSHFPTINAPGGENTLYPVMALGMYDRALFQRLRGFDERIHSEFFQVLDWGIRCYLLGHTVKASSHLLMQFADRQSIIEDRSENEGFKRCYTKALSIQQIKGKNLIRKYKGFIDKDALSDEVKKRLLWLQKSDFSQLLEHWEFPPEVLS